MFNHWDVVLDFVKACVRMTVIWVFSTILAIVLDSWGIRAENLLLVYLVGVLISILATGSLAWAFCAAFVFTFTFNYLFTEPKLTFHMDDLNYVISSVIFVAVAATVATLVLKLQKQMQIANKKTEITAKLNEIGSGFLNLSGYQQIKEYSEASLAAVRMTLALVGEGDRQTSTCSFVKYSFPAASRSRITSRFTRSAVRLNAISRRAERFSNVKKLIFALSAWFLWYILPSSRRWRSSSGEISTSSTWLALSNTESGMRSLTRTWVMDATIS